MCGRITYDPDQDHAAEQYDVDFKYEMSRFQHRNQFLPGEWIYGIVDGYDNKRVMSSFVWGFDLGGTLYNTRIETASELPTWRDSYAERRCIVPVSAFYEQGRKVISKAQPIMNVGAIYAKAPPVRRLSIITQNARGNVAEVHNRMPVILPDESVADWLNHEIVDADRFKSNIWDYNAELVIL